MKIFNKLIHWYFTKKALPFWLVLLLDCSLVVLSGLIVHTLRAGVWTTLTIFGPLVGTLCCYLFFYLCGFRMFHTYTGVLRYSSFVDLMRVAYANFIGVLLIFIVRHIFYVDTWLVPLAWKELAGTFVIATLLMWGVRIFVKYLYDVCFVDETAQRVFIYGVRAGGVALARSIMLQEPAKYVVVGFVSDEISSCKHLINGVKVYYNNDNLVHLMRKRGADVLMVSPLRSEALRNNQQMVDRLSKAGIKIFVYGGTTEWDGKSGINHTQLREVQIEDLLPRDEIKVDLDKVREELTGHCILITGAAGSIGSEIVRQVSQFAPSQLVLIDQAETPLHDIRLMMARKWPDIPTLTLTASICHQSHMEKVFSLYKPDYVFHAAAYKHVPMMEDNPGESVYNNVHGTRIIADLAVKYGVEKFVMVSTDKAVNPTNVMGCSKRICEMYVQSLDRAIKAGKMVGKTRFVTTRFGNVLGSNGSVIPLFREQIKAGGPLTVTHPDIIRFFMLIPEACKLVLEAGTIGQGGEIFVFDMGNPVKISDLAKRMIALSGASDIKIKYTGLRDGEKLYEELLSKEENTMPSAHPKIRIAKVRELSYPEVCKEIEELVAVAQDYDDMAIVRKMKGIVPEFISKHSKYETLDKENKS